MQVRTKPLRVARATCVSDERAVEHEPPTELAKRLQVADAIGDVPARAGR